jgi:EAL domain-containing protein (putative c-di-GMP-specific phosphodiesterase class I)
MAAHHETSALLGRARSRLVEAARATAAELPPSIGVLDELADQLLAMRLRGFSNEALAGLLSESGLGISAVALTDYLQGRVLAQLVASGSSGGIHAVGSPARACVIEARLRSALATGTGLSLHYQPQVDMATGKTVGAEALLRWRHGNEFVSPTEFIPVAEASDLIDRIGDWVLKQAAMDAARWMQMGLGSDQGIKVSVNVSVKQLSSRFAGVVHGALCDAGVPTRMLALEVTESQLASEGALDYLTELRESGLCLAVDDFGTGYSSLARINRLPLDIIKIDRTFVQDLGRSAGAAAVVEAILGMAKKLGIKTIAEGVETALQAQVLQSLGCTIAQGYFYARPMQFDDFIAFSRS